MPGALPSEGGRAVIAPLICSLVDTLESYAWPKAHGSPWPMALCVFRRANNAGMAESVIRS